MINLYKTIKMETKKPTIMYGVLKNCCPTLSDNEYHIRAWHPRETNLKFELEWVRCAVCAAAHGHRHCPYIHPLNRTSDDGFINDNDDKANITNKKWIGPSCTWCGSKQHLGVECPKRNSDAYR